jgi:hypothetical protein
MLKQTFLILTLLAILNIGCSYEIVEQQKKIDHPKVVNLNYMVNNGEDICIKKRGADVGSMIYAGKRKRRSVNHLT